MLSEREIQWEVRQAALAQWKLTLPGTPTSACAYCGDTGPGIHEVRVRVAPRRIMCWDCWDLFYFGIVTGQYQDRDLPALMKIDIATVRTLIIQKELTPPEVPNTVLTQFIGSSNARDERSDDCPASS